MNNISLAFAAPLAILVGASGAADGIEVSPGTLSVLAVSDVDVSDCRGSENWSEVEVTPEETDPDNNCMNLFGGGKRS